MQSSERSGLPEQELHQRSIALMRWALLIVAVVLLTIVTQIGGVVLLLTLALVRFFPERMRPRRLITAGFFVVCYLVASTVVVPPLASATGRVALPCFDATNQKLAALTPLTCALNRHYATPETAEAMLAMAADLQANFPGISPRYLDAAFPFETGMLMLPHLSHGDGRKVDFAFFYTGRNSDYQPGLSPSPIGYWAFERPADDTSDTCPQDTLLTLR
ncbi:MAG: hypothetical protein P8Q36_09115 [Alphaproteobacteria bacterium]|jgi:hypothetical protein|nr:hypothetical protein [Rhodospirillaceae bacterium]MBT6512501.1 hypothetical protein [Rhodospirillaceae bacterium]MDG2481009.1 hypothetical protein [Alphaproteobacteria bacterium]